MMSHKLLSSILSFLCGSLLCFPQSLTFKVIDSTDPVPGVHVSVNGNLETVADADGFVVLDNISPDDIVELSHLLYFPVRMPASSISTGEELSMIQKKYTIDDARVLNTDDYDILKQKMKPGLSLRTTVKKIPCTAITTVMDASGNGKYRLSEKCSLLFVRKGYCPIITGYSPDLTVLNSNKKPHLIYADERIRLVNKIGNSMWYANLICRKNRSEGINVEYRGRDGDMEVFYFFMPPQANNGEYKERGFIYLNAVSGEIVRMEETLTILNSTDNIYSYDLSVDFHYFEDTNTFLPEILYNRTYYYDSDLRHVKISDEQYIIDWDSL